MTIRPLKRGNPILQVRGLSKHFKIKRPLGQSDDLVKAVNEVSFDIYEGETYGLVGESGCGKSTTGRTILRLLEPTSGSIKLEGKEFTKFDKKEVRSARRIIQMVFQDPYTSLNPRIRIGKALEETLKIHGIGNRTNRTTIAIDILKKVGLNEDQYYRFPHEFSGGQRQRIGLARALIVNPKLIICDEPVSALDVSVQSQIINLLRSIQKDFNVSYLFIAHDISVVRHISDRIGVMYLGNIVEEAETNELFSNPQHPYTQALLSAIPIPDPQYKMERIMLKGEIPSPLNPPDGCVFHTRCPSVQSICREKEPVRTAINDDHVVSCHLVNQLNDSNPERLLELHK